MKNKKVHIGGILILLAAVMLPGPAYAEPKPDRRSFISMDMFENLPSVGDTEGTSETPAISKEEEERLKRVWQKINGVCYNGSGYPIPGAITRGIDVSSWQKQINWGAVSRSDIDFAIVRACYGTRMVDSYFDYNMTMAERAGVPVGVYVFSLAENPADALQEAQLVIDLMDGHKVSYPVFFDIETDELRSLPSAEITRIIRTFCNEVRRAGYRPAVYFNPYWYNNVVDRSSFADLDLWIAQYSDKLQRPTIPAGEYTIWQATDGDSDGLLKPTYGLVDGLVTDVDMDFGFVDYTKILTPRSYTDPSYTPASFESAIEGWYKVNGLTYYSHNGVKLNGCHKIGGKFYRFAFSDGHLFTDAVIWFENTKKVCYVDKTGAQVKDQWVTWRGKTYYMGSDYFGVKGLQYVDGQQYFFDRTTGVMMKNYMYYTVQHKPYYFGSDGRRARDCWVKHYEGNTYYWFYYDKYAQPLTGWHKINGWYRYFYPSGEQTGRLARNMVLELDGMCYRLNNNGMMIEKWKAS